MDDDRIKQGNRFKFLFEGDDVVALNISRTRAEDEGQYTCKAKNDLGSAATSAELIVNGKRM